MNDYMKEHFGAYTQEDLEAGRLAYAGGSVGEGSPLTIVEQYGAAFRDDQGKEYIDCTSQAWSLNIGGCHPRVVAAVSEQIRHTTHVRSGYGSIPKYVLNKRLTDITPGNLKKVGWSLHGSVANEGAMKLAVRNRPGRRYFLAPWRNFSGRTLATMGLCWPQTRPDYLAYTGHTVRFPQAYCYRCPFERIYPSCGLECARFLRSMIENSVDGEPLGIFMEPMQAGGGMIEYPVEYLRELRKICDDYDMLLIWDEIQTAFGRMGTMFAAELYDILPDIMTFGKAIGGGFPLAGTLHRTDMEDFGPQDHGFTFASYPVSMAAAIVTLRILQEEQLPQRAAKVGAHITSRLKEMQQKYELLGDIRGPGLMIAIELVKDQASKEPAVEEAKRFIQEGLKRGVLFGELGFSKMMNVIKIKPPLVISDEQVERVLDVFEEITAILSK
jgi:4-aminobutyrate aminotransferase-like enzyme